MARLPLLGQQAVRFEPYAPRATIFQTRLVLRALKILMVFVCGCVLLVRVGRDSTRYDNHNNYHLSSFFKSHPRQERINVTEILTAWIPFQRSTIFTLPSADSDQQNSLAALRGTALKIEIDPKEIYNPIARQPFYVGEGSVPGGRGVFNLGLLKLPEGSQWGYLGVARGLETVRDWIKVGDWPGKEQTLIMFGLNSTGSGLEIVSRIDTLDIPMQFKEVCLGAGMFAAYWGPEDARMFWTDAGTPAMTFGRYSHRPDRCRSLFFVPDIRALYPPSVRGIKAGNGIMAWSDSRARIIEQDQPSMLEMSRLEGQNAMSEKNWAALYPGASANGLSIVPHIHYSVSPEQIALSPMPNEEAQAMVIDFADIARKPLVGDCLTRHHPAFDASRFHQGSPAYRVSLCDEGCKPTAENTVFVMLVHASKNPSYRKLFVTMNVTSPFDLISVSPLFNLEHFDDAADIVYGLTIVPASDNSTISRPNPGHLFVNDEVYLSLGVRDTEIWTMKLKMKDVLSGHKLCRE